MTKSADRTGTKAPLRIGVAGLGTVGAGLVKLIARHRERLSAQTGRDIVVTAVSARDRGKDRGIDLANMAWHADARALAADPGIDVFIELMGGAEGSAREAVEAALKAGKPVVTANKALLAKHGVALARLAEEKGVALNFEAAVAGGIPVIKTLREALIGSDITRVYGILNGTCNFILTKMQDEGAPFAQVLKEAQELGYAEADPTFDIGGFDAAHKLAILASLAFGTEIAADAIHIEGIEGITAADIEAADDLGYRIKLLGVASRTPGGIVQRVSPTMVEKHSAIAEVSGVTNAVAIDGDFIGNLLLVGPGAGGFATASAVASDIVDLARGDQMFPLLTPAAKLKPYQSADLDHQQIAYYVRLSVLDKPGAMAAIATRMGEEGVSLESIVQRRPRGAKAGTMGRPAPGSVTPVVLITHDTTEAAMRRALTKIESDGKIGAKPQLIRIERLQA